MRLLACLSLSFATIYQNLKLVVNARESKGFVVLHFVQHLCCPNYLQQFMFVTVDSVVANKVLRKLKLLVLATSRE